MTQSWIRKGFKKLKKKNNKALDRDRFKFCVNVKN